MTNITIANHQYNLPKDVVVKKKGGKYLFLSPSIPAWIVTNTNGAKALKLCNGKRTIEEISDSRPSVKQEINHFLKEVATTTRLFSSIPPKHSYTPHNLKTVHLNLTNRCNLDCIYCYADERSNEKDILGYNDFIRIIDAINNIAKGVEIVLTGGEPLLVDYALDVAKYAKNRGNKLQLLSNGILLNKESAGQIAQIFDLVKISLDGNSPEINDFHRGKGSYEKIIRTIDLLIQNKAPLQISMTVTKKNIKDIGVMAKRFGSLLSFAPLFKAGKAKENRDLYITGKEYYNALSSNEGINPLSVLCTSFSNAQNHPIMKCAIGDAEISISDTGDVYPCHLLHLSQFKAGNVKKQSLESIYNSSEILKKCRELHVMNIGKCKKCDIRFICGGACRARAFFEKGKINVSDNFCKYEQTAYINGFFELYEF